MRQAVDEYVEEKKSGTPISDTVRKEVPKLPDYYQQKLAEKVRRKHYINLKAVSDRQYAETLSVYWDVGRGAGEKNTFFTPYSFNPREFAEHGWGMIADELDINMIGKELLDGFLASTEYQQALNGLDVVFKACKDFNDGKINERQVEKTVKKYLRRTGQDAADSIPELSEVFHSFTRQGLEP